MTLGTSPYGKTLAFTAERKPYDVAIIGGGLAGLALSIQLAKAGYKVAIFEKEVFPFHKETSPKLMHEFLLPFISAGATGSGQYSIC